MVGGEVLRESWELLAAAAGVFSVGGRRLRRAVLYVGVFCREMRTCGAGAGMEHQWWSIGGGISIPPGRSLPAVSLSPGPCGHF